MKKYNLHLYLLTIILSSLMSNTLWAKNDNANKSLVTVSGTEDVIYWDIHPSIRYESVTLSLSSDQQNETITSTDTPSISGLEDGGYTYQLVFTPVISPSIRNELKAARKAAHGQEAKEAVKALKKQGKIPQHRQVQSGYFTIFNGELVSLDETE